MSPICVEKQETMRYGSNLIAFIPFVLTAACAVAPGPGPHPGSGSGSGSGSGMPTVSEAFCNRLDSCNILVGSVNDCVQKYDRDLGALTPNERADVEMVLKTCLALRSCDTFVACLDPSVMPTNTAISTSQPTTP